MKDLSNNLLIEAYEMAVKLDLPPDFIQLIKSELATRKITVHL